jgi:hypothetical protein
MKKSLAAWLAITAMALNALWPLIAQARPATLVAVCTSSGVTHYVEIPGGSQPADSHQGHCSFCFSGAALQGSNFEWAPEAVSFSTPKGPGFGSRDFFLVEADARAPPVFLSVDSNNDNRRTNETAFALRAARADLGGSVLRLGILLD